MEYEYTCIIPYLMSWCRIYEHFGRVSIHRLSPGTGRSHCRSLAIRASTPLQGRCPFPSRPPAPLGGQGELHVENQPLPLAHRVIRANPSLQTSVLRLYKIWDGGSIRNQFEIHALLNSILGALERTARSQPGYDHAPVDSPWWRAEAGIRERRRFRPLLSELATLAGTGRGVLIRSCRKATGKTPMQRIREIRMEEGRGLITFAHMNFSQIADYLGYTRVHEFSREFSAFHHQSPSEFRKSLRTQPNTPIHSGG